MNIDYTLKVLPGCSRNGGHLCHRDVYTNVSRQEIGVRQMSGNKLMMLKLRLTIETDNRATVRVAPEVMFS